MDYFGQTTKYYVSSNLQYVGKTTHKQKYKITLKVNNVTIVVTQNSHLN